MFFEITSVNFRLVIVGLLTCITASAHVSGGGSGGDHGGSLGRFLVVDSGGSITTIGAGTLLGLTSLTPAISSWAASRKFALTDYQANVVRSNSGSAMNDSLPACSGLTRGWRVTVTNADASASDTITASGGTISGGMALVLTAGSSAMLACDSKNNAILRDLSVDSKSYVLTSASMQTYTVNPSLPGITIPSNFIGISFETQAVDESPSLNNNSALKTFLALLGSNGVIRVGGNSSDTYTPTIAGVTDLANFVNGFGSGWSLIYGLSCKLNARSAPASQAAAISHLLSSRVTYQIGNEPDLYVNGPCHPGFSTYQNVWTSTNSAVLALVPDATFYGPDSYSITHTTYITNFATNLGPKATGLSIHHYGAKSTDDALADITSLLQETYLRRAVASIPALPAVAKSGLPLRVTESGSLLGGLTSNANTLGASIYDIWVMISLAANGWKNVDWEQGYGTTNANGYAPLYWNIGTNNYTAQDTFYAMVFFAPLSGASVIPQTTTVFASVEYLSAKDGKGRTRVLLVNKDLNSSNVVAVGSTASFSSASIVLYTGPSCLKSTVQLGGTTISNAGVYTPIPYTVAKVGRFVPINIPPCSAVMATLN